MKHSALAQSCLESYHHATFNLGECEAMIKYCDAYSVVVFRGTECGSLFAGRGWVDVLRDLRLMPWYDKDCGWCHAGFLKGAKRSAKFLDTVLNKERPVIFTGHSLGGALSLLCAAKMQAAGYRVSWVGFGSPKAQHSKKTFGFSQVNYRYRADVVPSMPRFSFYRHNYQMINLGRAKEAVEPTWDDHDIQLYIKALA